MNKILLRAGGLVNLLFVAFQLSMVKSIGEALAPLSPDIRATVSTLNVQAAFTLLIFAYLAFFRWRDLLTTRLGNVTAIAISLFWFLRGADQVVFYGYTAADMPMLGLCLLFGLLYLIPVIREWKNVPSEARPPAGRRVVAASKSQERTGRMSWAAYAAVAWCVLFGGLHLYWAVGGNAGLAELSMPSNRTLALTRAPVYMAITWGVVIVCAIGALVALGTVQPWGRRIPRWILLTPMWIGCGLSILRGAGTLIQTALMIGGGMPFDPLPASEVQAWNQYLLIDSIFYSPWWILGGIAFGLTAWSAIRGGGQQLTVDGGGRAAVTS